MKNNNNKKKLGILYCFFLIYPNEFYIKQQDRGNNKNPCLEDLDLVNPAGPSRGASVRSEYDRTNQCPLEKRLQWWAGFGFVKKQEAATTKMPSLYRCFFACCYFPTWLSKLYLLRVGKIVCVSR